MITCLLVFIVNWKKNSDILENSGEEYIVIIIIKQKNNSGGPDQP